MSVLTFTPPPVEPTPSPAEQRFHSLVRELEDRARNAMLLHEFIHANALILQPLSWNIRVVGATLVINAEYSQKTPEEIAALFPGEWQLDVPSDVYTSGDYLDWRAERGDITVRIERARKIVYDPPRERIATF